MIHAVYFVGDADIQLNRFIFRIMVISLEMKNGVDVDNGEEASGTRYLEEVKKQRGKENGDYHVNDNSTESRRNAH